MKALVSFTILLSMMLFLSGCQRAQDVSTPPPATDTPPMPSKLFSTDDGSVVDLLSISAEYEESASSARLIAELFFGYAGDQMLGRERRELTKTHDTRAEALLIGALLSGPSVERSDLVRLFEPGTRLMSLYDQDGILFVSLSREFLDIPASLSSRVSAGDSDAISALRTKRRLALLSLINTVTQMGELDAVQLLISGGADDIDGMRVSRSEIFDDADGGSRLVGAMQRDESVILTHANTLRRAADLWISRDWPGLYLYVSADGAPTSEAFSSLMSQLPNAPVAESHSPGIVTEDGTAAVFRADISWMRDGQVWPWSGTVLLRLERGAWKIPVSTLMRLGGYEYDLPR